MSVIALLFLVSISFYLGYLVSGYYNKRNDLSVRRRISSLLSDLQGKKFCSENLTIHQLINCLEDASDKVKLRSDNLNHYVDQKVKCLQLELDASKEISTNLKVQLDSLNFYFSDSFKNQNDKVMQLDILVDAIGQKDDFKLSDDHNVFLNAAKFCLSEISNNINHPLKFYNDFNFMHCRGDDACVEIGYFMESLVRFYRKKHSDSKIGIDSFANQVLPIDCNALFCSLFAAISFVLARFPQRVCYISATDESLETNLFKVDVYVKSSSLLNDNGLFFVPFVTRSYNSAVGIEENLNLVKVKRALEKKSGSIHVLNSKYKKGLTLSIPVGNYSEAPPNYLKGEALNHLMIRNYQVLFESHSVRTLHETQFESLNVNVLIVDLSWQFPSLIRDALKKYESNVDIVNDLDCFLDKALNTTYHVIIVDSKFPSLDVISILNKYKFFVCKSEKRMPSIILTAYDLSSTDLDSFQPIVDFVFFKKLGVDRLLSLIYSLSSKC